MSKLALIPRLLDKVGLRLKSLDYLRSWNSGESMGAFGSGHSPRELTRPYADSAWVQGVIKMVVDPIADADLKFTTDARGGKQALTAPNVNAFWQRPARDAEGPMTYADTIRATASWLKLSGEAFWILGEEWVLPSSNAQRQPFIIVRPDKMREICLGTQIIGWEYKDARGMAYDLIPERVIHLKLWNPYHQIRGMSEYQAAKVAAEADYYSAEFVRNLAKNNGDRGDWVISKGGQVLDKSQKETIIAGLKAKRAANLAGEFRPGFLEGDITIQSPSIGAPDAAFINARKELRYEIATAFRVPPSLVDLAPSHSIGTASDNYRLIEQACMPLAGKIADYIEQVTMRLGPAAPRGAVYAQLSFSKHSAVVQARVANIQNFGALCDRGMPPYQASETLNLDLPRFPGDDVGLVPFTVQTLKGTIDAPAPETDPSLAEGLPPEKPAKARTIESADRLIALMESRRPEGRLISLLTNPLIEEKSEAELDAAMDEVAADMCGHRFDGVTGRIPNILLRKSANRDALWSNHMAQRRPIVKSFVAKVRKTLLSARIETLKKIAEAQRYDATHNIKAGVEIHTKRTASELVFDLVKFGTHLWLRLQPVEDLALDTAGQQLFDEVGMTDPWKTPNADALLFAADRKNKIGGASETIFNAVKDAIQVGITEGKAYDDIATDIKAVFNKLADYEATRIAQTETAAAYGLGRDLAMKRAGVAWKEWLTSRNSNVRPAHAAAEEQKRPFNEAFDVGGFDMQYPGDSDGGAGPDLIINCHCVSVAIKKPGDAGEDES